MEFRSIIDIHVREYDRIMLEKSWEWLNDPEIKQLTLTPEMKKESQDEWFQNLRNRKDYFIVGVWRNDEPIGVVGIKNIVSSDGELFGYIGEKKYWGKGIGADMMKITIDKARDLGLTSVYSVIGTDNINSQRLHRRFGFKMEKKLDGGRIIMRLQLNKK